MFQPADPVSYEVALETGHDLHCGLSPKNIATLAHFHKVPHTLTNVRGPQRAINIMTIADTLADLRGFIEKECTLHARKTGIRMIYVIDSP